MSDQKQKGRSHNKFKSDKKESDWIIMSDFKNNSIFKGYDKEHTVSKITKYRNMDSKNLEVILDQTPFYAESGGQVGDTGFLKNDNFSFKVNDTYKIGDDICHLGIINKGNIGDQHDMQLTAKINCSKRTSTKLNHTATHLLHKALKDVLGNHVQQAGSLVSYDRLRFDLTHYEKVSNR